MPVTASQGTAGQLQEAPALAALAESVPAFAAAVGLQQEVVDLAIDRLLLAPVHCSATGPAGVFAASSTDGSAGACTSAHRGGRVRWLSASALGNSQLGFGATRLLGYVGAAADVPHFVLEQGLQGDKVRAGFLVLLTVAAAPAAPPAAACLPACAPPSHPSHAAMLCHCLPAAVSGHHHAVSPPGLGHRPAIPACLLQRR